MVSLSTFPKLQNQQVKNNKLADNSLDGQRQQVNELGGVEFTQPLGETNDLEASKSDKQLDQEYAPARNAKLLNIINRLDGHEATDGIETIEIRNVEQGKCANFKRLETTIERRPSAESKHSQVSRHTAQLYNNMTTIN